MMSDLAGRGYLLCYNVDSGMGELMAILFREEVGEYVEVCSSIELFFDIFILAQPTNCALCIPETVF